MLKLVPRLQAKTDARPTLTLLQQQQQKKKNVLGTQGVNTGTQQGVLLKKELASAASRQNATTPAPSNPLLLPTPAPSSVQPAAGLLPRTTMKKTPGALVSGLTHIVPQPLAQPARSTLLPAPAILPMHATRAGVPLGMNPPSVGAANQMALNRGGIPLQQHLRPQLHSTTSVLGQGGIPVHPKFVPKQPRVPLVTQPQHTARPLLVASSGNLISNLISSLQQPVYRAAHVHQQPAHVHLQPRIPTLPPQASVLQRMIHEAASHTIRPPPGGFKGNK